MSLGAPSQADLLSRGGWSEWGQGARRVPAHRECWRVEGSYTGEVPKVRLCYGARFVTVYIVDCAQIVSI